MNHNFDVDIAVEYGVHAAVLLENIRYWIEKNRANGRHFHDGLYWTYSSAKAFTELFPYMTDRQVRYALQRLTDNGIVVTGNYNASTYDRTLWYALTEKGDSICRKTNFQVTNLVNGNTENVKPIPDINTDINTDINKREGHSPSRPRTGARTHTLRYGLYQNVKLSAEELAKLKEEYPRDWSARIDHLSEYIASKGNKYRSHYATIRRWARMDAEQASGVAKPAKVNPAQQYEQRKYDNDKMAQRLAVNFGELEGE